MYDYIFWDDSGTTIFTPEEAETTTVYSEELETTTISPKLDLTLTKDSDDDERAELQKIFHIIVSISHAN